MTRHVPAETRNAIAKTAREMVDNARDKMLEFVSSDEMLALTFEAIKSRLIIGSRCQECGQEGRAPRDGPRLIAELYGAIDAAPQLQVAIQNYLSVSPEVAKQRVDMVAELDEMDTETRFLLCRDFILQECERDRTLLKELKPLFKLIPQAEVSK